MARKLLIEIESGGPGIKPEGITSDFLVSYVAQLKRAMARCAQQIITGKSEGRTPDRVRDLEVVFKQIESASFHAEAEPFDKAIAPDPKWAHISDDAFDRLTDQLDQIRQKPDAENIVPAVRALVDLIPAAQEQRFTFYNGAPTPRIVVLRSSRADAVDIQPVAAKISRHLCTIRSVSFRPNRSVQFARGMEGLLRATAADALLEKAWQLKDEPAVVAVVVAKSDGSARLIGLRTATDEQARSIREVPLQETLDRAGEVLKALADHDAGKK